MNLENKFRESHPHAFFLDDNIEALQDYLIHQGWFDESLAITSSEKAGEGNMNKVLRVQIDDGDTFIIKQSRPWVEKFPDIPAPSERANIEGIYFEYTGQNKTIASFAPDLMHADPDASILVIEDLGRGSDLSYLYKKEQVMDEETIVSLMNYISALHQNFAQEECNFYIENRGMRKLNAEHIFRFPFVEDNGLDLDEITPGLAKLAAKYRNDEELMEQIEFLSYRYLQNGDTLVQGDFYPGSFLDTKDGIKVIDPEFCFFGDAEFDLGVFYAHMLMAEQPEKITKGIMEYYKRPAHFSEMLYEQYAGIEIMRRIFGLAQLPLELNLDEKKELSEKAYGMLMGE